MTYPFSRYVTNVPDRHRGHLYSPCTTFGHNSLIGACGVVSKLAVAALMILGRHRGLPDSVDRAVQTGPPAYSRLPSNEQQQQGEGEEGDGEYEFSDEEADNEGEDGTSGNRDREGGEEDNANTAEPSQ